MCLYPKFIKNKAYEKHSPYADDERKKYVPVGCGKCYECKRQKAQSWRVRLHEELKTYKGQFITLTFSNEELEKLCKETKTTECNAIATLAVRRFLERYRKRYKKSLRHWLITELGHEGTERIHLHGIIFRNEPISKEELEELWKYGRTDIGEYCNAQTINYIVKYVTKIDKDHKNFEAIILCSAGIGSEFVKTIAAQNTYKYKKGKTPEYYRLPDGNKVALPIYYRNKLFNRSELAKMWTDRLDKHTIYVNGIPIFNTDTEKGQKTYMRTIETQQRLNEQIGYGNTTKEWQKLPYNVTFKMLQTSRCIDTASRSTKSAREVNNNKA